MGRKQRKAEHSQPAPLLFTFCLLPPIHNFRPFVCLTDHHNCRPGPGSVEEECTVRSAHVWSSPAQRAAPSALEASTLLTISWHPVSQTCCSFSGACSKSQVALGLLWPYHWSSWDSMAWHGPPLPDSLQCVCSDNCRPQTGPLWDCSSLTAKPSRAPILFLSSW